MIDANVLALALLAHLTGDYLLQSSWMAKNKVERWWPAVVHGVAYTMPFLLLTQAPAALLVIGGTHTVIDRTRAARTVVVARNYLAPPSEWTPWRKAADVDWTTPKNWALRVIVDNTMHMIINAGALIWLR